MADKTPTKQEIPKPDVSEHASRNPVENSTTTADDNASVSLFDAAGGVQTSPPTESATMPKPEGMPEKRGRGRPAGTGKKKAPAKTVEEKQTSGLAAAHLAVKGLDIIRFAVSNGECAPNPELREHTVESYRAFIEQNGWEVPAWMQVVIISGMYVTPAFATENGKSKLSRAWAGCKAWYIKRRG